MTARKQASRTGASFAGSLALCLATAATAQEASEEGEDLAQQLANPVASLIQVPIQGNVDFGIGPDGEGFRITTNVQPVVPIAVNDDWNVISRTIVPVVYQEDVTGPGTSQFGVGDTVQSFFFSPKEIGDSGIIWGAGPVFLLPTGTEQALSGRKWGVGPTGVILKQTGPWSTGLLVNQIWSFAGDDDRQDVDQALLQPFVSYVTPEAVTYSASLDVTHDWLNDRTTVPLNIAISKLIKGKQPLSIGAGARYYIEKPNGGPDWGLRATLTLLFPQ